MRQTSRAVALLLALEGANAANATPTPNDPATVTIGGGYLTVFNPLSSVTGMPSTSQQLNNRNAGYTGKAQTWTPDATPTAVDGSHLTVGWTTATFRAAKVLNTAAVMAITAAPLTVAGSGCVQCIRGAGVWCSRTYSYLSTSDTLQYDGLTAAYNATVLADSDAKLVTGASLDQGACCQSQILFNTFLGTKAAPTPTTELNNNATSKAGAVMVSAACPAVNSPDFVGTATAAS